MAPNFRRYALSAKLFKTKFEISKEKNQTQDLANFAINFLKKKQYISEQVYERAKTFHTDGAVWAISAISMKLSECTMLRESALNSHSYSEEIPDEARVAKLFGSNLYTDIEKVISANVAAMHELNANGFSLGYSNDDPEKEGVGEVDHNR